MHFSKLLSQKFLCCNIRSKIFNFTPKKSKKSGPDPLRHLMQQWVGFRATSFCNDRKSLYSCKVIHFFRKKMKHQLLEQLNLARMSLIGSTRLCWHFLVRMPTALNSTETTIYFVPGILLWWKVNSTEFSRAYIPNFQRLKILSQRTL